MSSARTVAWVALISILSPTVVLADASGGNWTFWFDPGNSATTAQVAAQSSAPPKTADAYLNFGATSLYPEASALTIGSAAPWYQSPSVTQAFGHTPNAAERSAFTAEVLSDVNSTFSQAGLSPQITLDPTVPANHTLSVVSGLSYGPNPNAIGITDVGHNGFGFIDKLAYAGSPDQLAWAVAHNVSHELMHAFGVGVHADQTGQYLDAATATWGLLTDPQATFSPAAVGLIQATNFGASVTSSALSGKGEGLITPDGDQEILAVPEPATLVAWSVVIAGVLYRRRGRSVGPRS